MPCAPHPLTPSPLRATQELLKRAQQLTAHAIRGKPLLEAIHFRSVLASVFSIATSSPDHVSSARLLPYASRVLLSPNQTVFDCESYMEASLYLLVLGEVELIELRGWEVRNESQNPMRAPP